MYYIIGDIHGELVKLQSLIRIVITDFDVARDKFIFLGDYIDRGESSFQTVEFLISFAKKYNTVFLTGNHEDMFQGFLDDRDMNFYLFNGGLATVESYKNALGHMTVPNNHKDFFSELKLYYEGDDFIAVHAGLHPACEDLLKQNPDDLKWIREGFYLSKKRWQKTVIFGHTSVQTITKNSGVYFDEKRNIIGIDNGVFLGYPLLCLRWPDRKVYSSS